MRLGFRRLMVFHGRFGPHSDKALFIRCYPLLVEIISEQVTAGRCKWRQKLLQSEMLTRTWLGS